MEFSRITFFIVVFAPLILAVLLFRKLYRILLALVVFAPFKVFFSVKSEKFSKFDVIMFSAAYHVLRLVLGEKGEKFFIEKINQITLERIRGKKFKPHEVLLLLPHCLQKSFCTIRLKPDLSNCAHCGKCDVSALRKVVERYNILCAIVSGGTAARNVVKATRPKLIVAVACERDLASGMADVLQIPVYGVINERPEGPCINTIVDVEEIEKILKDVVEVEDLSNSPEHSRGDVSEA